MYQTTPMIAITGDSQEAIRRTIDRLTFAGLRVVRSFDLRVALSAHTGSNCPHHGTDRCSCQMVMLLVYDQSDTPVTLVIHGYDRQVQISIVDTPDQHPSGELVEGIVQVIIPKDEAGTKASRIYPGDGLHAL